MPRSELSWAFSITYSRWRKARRLPICYNLVVINRLKIRGRKASFLEK